MEKIFDKNTLMQTSIFELRDIARTIGVYSPTIYKKEELIDKMFRIINGDDKPYVPKSRQGRPPKNLSGATKTLESFLPSKEERTYDLETESSIGVLSEGIIAFLEDTKNPVLNIESFVGYLDILDGTGYGIIRPLKNSLRETKTVYVSSGQIENFNLKSGDLLEVEARVLHKEKPLVLSVVKKINGRDFKSGVRNSDFETLPIEFPIKEIRFDEEIVNKDVLTKLNLLPLICGSRNLILINKGTKFDNVSIIRALNSLLSGKFVYLGLELLPELIPFVDNIKGCETLYCALGEDVEKQARTTHLAIDRVKRIVEEKDDVVLFVDSVDKVIKNENFLNDNNINDINKKTMATIKLLLSKARSIAMGGSLTEICVMYYDENNMFDKTIISELTNLFTNIIYA